MSMENSARSTVLMLVNVCAAHRQLGRAVLRHCHCCWLLRVLASPVPAADTAASFCGCPPKIQEAPVSHAASKKMGP